MLLLIQYTLVFSSILTLVALGGCYSERSGIINIGLEGIMVIGGLGGILVLAYIPANLPAIVIFLAATLAAAICGMLYSLLLIAAWLVLTVKWKVQLALTVRRFRSGGGLGKTPFERAFGIGMTVLAVLLAAASFLVYMKTGTAS